VTGAMRKPPLERIAPGARTPLASARSGKRKVRFAGLGKPIVTPVYDRRGLCAGNRFAGPALVEEHASTTVVPPGDRLQVDEYGNLVIEIARRRT
jgi:N-methylhydantoinase A